MGNEKSVAPGTSGGTAKSKPSTASASGGAAKSKPSTTGASSGAEKSKPLTAGASGGAAKSKSATTGVSGAPEKSDPSTPSAYDTAISKPSAGGATKSKPSTTGVSSGAAKSKQSTAGASDGAAKSKPSTGGASDAAEKSDPPTAGAYGGAAISKPPTGGASNGAAKSKPSTTGASSGAAKSKPSTAGASDGAAVSKPSTAGAAKSKSKLPTTIAAKSKLSVVGASGAAAESKSKLPTAGAAKSKLSVAGVSDGAEESKPSAAGAYDGAANSQPSTASASSSAPKSKPSTAGAAKSKPPTASTAKSKLSIAGASSGAAKSNPSTASAYAGAAISKPSTAGAEESKPSTLGASDGAKESKPSTAGAYAGTTKNSQPATASVSGGAAKSEPATAGVSGAAAEAHQASAYSKDTVPRHRSNMQMVQNVLLIWVDNNIDDNSVDCCKTISQLRRTVNTINTFTDGDQCFQFLETMENEKVCMIISGSLGQHIVPCVHDMFQVDSIFIFCGNKKKHEQWTKQWSKIKGVFTEITPICEALKQAAHQCEQNATSMSFIATSTDGSTKKLDQLDPSFMYTQIMKEILLTINFEPKHFTQFFDYCREVFADNEDELTNVTKLEIKYPDKTPIWWYTFECFLYPMLNRALRLMDADIIIKLGFFIGDLHRHIERLHKQQFSGQQTGKTFKVYRGQGMSKIEFEQMSKTKGGLISFNNFLSTSKDRTVSLDFANRAVQNPDLVGVVFIMTIDPSQSTTPFASIIDVSYFQGEREVLFAMHTVFRICDIKPMGGNHRLFQVELTLTSDNDKDLRQLTDRIREETFPDSSGWYRLGLVLLQMGQHAKAEDVYQILLDQATEESATAPIYIQLGSIKVNQEEYKEAITFYEKALEIYKKTLPSNHPHLAGSYNNIGGVYENMNEYSKALSSHEKALEIRQQSLPPNHPDLAASYNNIGLVYYKTSEYSKALSSYEKALEIRQQSLPANHPDLAASYNNIGATYKNMGNYSKALSFYERAVNIAQQSLPPDHPHRQIYKKNLDRIKNKL